MKRPDHLFALSRPLALLLGAAVLLAGAAPAGAQPLARTYSKEGADLRAAFRPVVGDIGQSVVRILDDEETVSLGVIVSSDGEILTKASEIDSQITVDLPDETKAAAILVGRDADSDLALLRVDAEGLRPVQWTDEPVPVGSWLISAGPGKIPIGIGIVGLNERDVATQRGMLGIRLGVDDIQQRPMVVGVFPGSGADVAGLRAGDIILQVAGIDVPDRQSLLECLSDHRPGETLTIQILRNDAKERVRATLSSVGSVLFGSGRRRVMSGPVSTRCGGFEDVLQHGTFLEPSQCGGPVLNLDGEVVGINIARAGRIETFALPAGTVQEILARLRQDERQTAQVSAAGP